MGSDCCTRIIDPLPVDGQILHQYFGLLPVWVRLVAPLYWSPTSIMGLACCTRIIGPLPVEAQNVHQYIGPLPVEGQNVHQYIGPLPIWVRIVAPVYWSPTSMGSDCCTSILVSYQYGFGLLHQYIGPLPVWVRIVAPV